MTSPHDDLVERLKSAHENSAQRIVGSNIFEEAATRIEQQAAEIERLKADAERYRWLRQSKTFAPDEEGVPGAVYLDSVCDNGIARSALNDKSGGGG